MPAGSSSIACMYNYVNTHRMIPFLALTRNGELPTGASIGKHTHTHTHTHAHARTHIHTQKLHKMWQFLTKCSTFLWCLPWDPISGRLVKWLYSNISRPTCEGQTVPFPSERGNLPGLYLWVWSTIWGRYYLSFSKPSNFFPKDEHFVGRERGALVRFSLRGMTQNNTRGLPRNNKTI